MLAVVTDVDLEARLVYDRECTPGTVPEGRVQTSTCALLRLAEIGILYVVDTASRCAPGIFNDTPP